MFYLPQIPKKNPNRERELRKGKKKVKPLDSQVISHLVDLFRWIKVIDNKQEIQAMLPQQMHSL